MIPETIQPKKLYPILSHFTKQKVIKPPTTIERTKAIQMSQDSVDGVMINSTKVSIIIITGKAKPRAPTVNLSSIKPKKPTIIPKITRIVNNGHLFSAMKSQTD